ncbi:MAG: ATP-binding protein [Clostridiales bacterium]|nr:ATP-binding protein [Clostridiales bacterium]
MTRYFNVNGACNPNRHYMVDLTSRLQEIRAMVDRGEYFTINRARQYGKTTTIRALEKFLQADYMVVSLDFQNIESAEFGTGSSFVHALTREINKKIRRMEEVPKGVEAQLAILADRTDQQVRMADLMECFSKWCEQAARPIVLIIDEVDTASNNQVFLDFLAQLRAAYLDRDTIPTFQSVILAGVYDIRNIRRKLRPEEEHKTNSPWNIAADFLVDMSFSVSDIAGMLEEYEADHSTGMNVESMARLLYDYTSGYPYLVSRLCKLLDERISRTERFSGLSAAWTKGGLLEAVKLLVAEKNPLFESLLNKITDYPELRTVVYDLLFTGRAVPYSPWNRSIEVAEMFGFVRNEKGSAVISNRIFESILYNYFMSEEYITSKLYDAGLQEKNQFIAGGHLNVRRILEKFVETFDYLYGDRDEEFLEDTGRRYFLLFLKPIINGVGNSYVEAETRNRERMDVVIDYRGEQFIIEMKIWRGNTYHERGEEQLAAYLDYFHLKKGYMLSFNFNKNKEIGVKEIVLGDRVLVEAVV